MYYDQAAFDIRCEWGEQGVTALAGSSDVVIIVDVFSFSTCVEVAVSRKAVVLPCAVKGEAAESIAAAAGAQLVSARRSLVELSLSPTSLLSLGAGMHIVLPSPNGATLSVVAVRAQAAAFGDRQPFVFAGCLRNAAAVAAEAARRGSTIAVIPAGERWWHDYSLRPAFEDLVGAGAIIRHLGGSRSPEAEAAVGAYAAVEANLALFLRNCSSGRELVEQGFGADVDLAAELDAGDSAPLMQAGAYRGGHGS